ncbi:hypothetical protein MCHUDSM44219_00673 [Mycolicibacterium chubuense]|uniref:Uncharacterized protein n=1 Tax=Mycolicibacterium chubuense TaxID=1800 RepID=A0A0J6ZHM6_MYCCU|nr:hypothetical protein MCHUDSM44219_00673 [Mycolicibacterium chubuense]SPY00444.1 Uncharacterised protein [Mycolicibacterium chubuense]
MLIGIVSTELPQPQQILDTKEEARTTDAADENSDLHTDRD